MSNMGSLILYLLIFAISSTLIFYGTQYKRSLFTYTGLALPAILSALRFNVGTDYHTYIAMYQNLHDLPLKNFLSVYGYFKLEPTFYVLSQLSYRLVGGPELLFGIFGFLSILFFYLGLRRLNVGKIGIVMCLYLTMIFPLTFNMVRQGVAVSIIFYAISFSIEKKFWKYLFWVLVAAIFHFTAILALPLYYLPRIVGQRLSINRNIARILGAFILLSLTIPRIINTTAELSLFSKYAAYTTFVPGGTGGNYSFYIKLILVFSALILYKFKKLKGQNVPLYILLAAVELALLSVGFFAPFIRRISVYMMPFTLLLVPEFIEIFPRSYKRRLAYLAIIAFGLLYFISVFYILGNSDIFPYNLVTKRGL